MVLLDTPFSFYIKTSRARLLLSTSYFEVKVVSLLFRHTLRVHMPAADRVTYTQHFLQSLSRRLSSARDASPPMRALGRRKHLLMVAAPVRAHSLCALTLSPQSVAVHALARFGCEPTIACRVPRLCQSRSSVSRLRSTTFHSIAPAVAPRKSTRKSVDKSARSLSQGFHAEGSLPRAPQ